VADPRGAVRARGDAAAGVGGAFIYQATRSSSRVLAAELTVDHEKCFRLNRLLGTHHSPETVEASMASAFDWKVHCPTKAARES
jgi:hypothetical protein